MPPYHIMFFRRLPLAIPRSLFVRFASSAPEGTKINLNIYKNQTPIVAKADSEYPEWLWKVLDPKAQAEALKNDPIRAARKARRQANKQKIKENNFLAAMAK